MKHHEENITPHRLLKLAGTTLALIHLALSSARGDNPSIAAADFTSAPQTHADQVLTRTLPDLVSRGLVRSGRFDVYEREKLNTILREQSFQVSGFADSKTAVAMGKLAGVRYILTGQIIDNGAKTQTFSGYGMSTRTTFYNLAVSIKIVDVETGRNLLDEMREAKMDDVTESRVDASTIRMHLAENVATNLVQAVLESRVFKPAEATGEKLVAVKFTSEPEKADVDIDGVFYGNTGGAIKIPSGLHQITISLSGYDKWSKKVQISSELPPIHVKLARVAETRIEVQSKP